MSHQTLSQQKSNLPSETYDKKPNQHDNLAFKEEQQSNKPYQDSKLPPNIVGHRQEKLIQKVESVLTYGLLSSTSLEKKGIDHLPSGDKQCRSSVCLTKVPPPYELGDVLGAGGFGSYSIAVERKNDWIILEDIKQTKIYSQIFESESAATMKNIEKINQGNIEKGGKPLSPETIEMFLGGKEFEKKIISKALTTRDDGEIEKIGKEIEHRLLHSCVLVIVINEDVFRKLNGEVVGMGREAWIPYLPSEYIKYVILAAEKSAPNEGFAYKTTKITFVPMTTITFTLNCLDSQGGFTGIDAQGFRAPDYLQGLMEILEVIEKDKKETDIVFMHTMRLCD